MNIAFFTTHPVNPYIGGIEKITYNLAQYFKSQNIGIFYFHLKGENSNNHFILPNFSNNYIAKFIDEKIIKHKIDIIIDQYGTNHYFSHEHLKSNIKIIRCIHSNITENHITRCLLETFLHKKKKEQLINFLYWLNTPRRRQKQKKEYKYIIKNVDILCLLSQFYKNEYIINYPADNIVSINNAIPMHHSNDEKKEKIIIYCGRIIHNPKNILFVIHIWEQLYTKYKDWKMILVGDGEDRYIIENLIKKKKLPRISVTGFTDPTVYYQKAQILILPSYNEGFPMSLIEAMSYGCVPIVFNTVPAFQDIIKNGINGYIINELHKKDFIEKCQHLIENPFILKKFSQNARLHIIENFSIEKIGAQWINLFNILLKK